MDVSKLQSEVDDLRKKAAEKIPKRPTEIIKHDQKPVNNTANEQTTEKVPETIHRNVVNHLSPISPTGTVCSQWFLLPRRLYIQPCLSVLARLHKKKIIIKFSRMVCNNLRKR